MKRKIALQVFSVRDFAEQDLKGTLTKIKAMGYDGVEFAGGVYGNDPLQVKAWCEELGLVPISAHLSAKLLRECKNKIDDFATIDLRVCEIVKAQEIRKSHSCLKLTLNDGIGERVIVSSIKAEYKCEDLIGKKIIVIANLKPNRITGVTSQGMLLAATNNACGCKVIFVDDSVPAGTQIK
jgi:methionine--tRNA ligase beta chain